MPLELNEIIQRLERLLVTDLASTFEELRKVLIPQDDAWDSMILIEGRYNDIKIKILRGTLSDDQTALQTNQVREDLLHFIQALKEKDLVGYEPSEEATAYEGHLLYKIPLTMNHNEKSSCFVRIAIEKAAITKYLELTEEIKQYGLEKVSDVMQVQLVDPTMSDAFQIYGVNEPEQLILKKGYTEWRFDVTPLKSGVFPLLLKVAVLIMVNGKERKREITLEKEINVTTIKVEQEEVGFVQSDVKLNMGGTAIVAAPLEENFGTLVNPSPTASAPPSLNPPISSPSPSPPKSSSGSGNFRKIISGLSAVLLLAIGFYMFQNDKDKSNSSGELVVTIPPDNPGNSNNSNSPIEAKDHLENSGSSPVKIQLAPQKSIFDFENEGGQHFVSVEVPAVFENQIVDRPRPSAPSSVQTVPSRAEVTTRKVLIPGTDPPQFRTETVVVQTAPETLQVIKPFQRFDTVKVLVTPATTKKIPVLSSDKVTPKLLKQIQKLLGEKKYDIGQPGDAQEVINKKFKEALISYQKDNSLPMGNLDYETLNHLGVDYEKK